MRLLKVPVARAGFGEHRFHVVTFDASIACRLDCDFPACGMVFKNRATGDATGEAGLRELAEKVPLSFYGLMAADRLGLEPRFEDPFVRTRLSPGPFEPVRSESMESSIWSAVVGSND